MKLNKRELLAAIARKHSTQAPQNTAQAETVEQFLARGGQVQVCAGFVHSPDLRRAGRVNYRQGGQS